MYVSEWTQITFLYIRDRPRVIYVRSINQTEPNQSNSIQAKVKLKLKLKLKMLQQQQL